MGDTLALVAHMRHKLLHGKNSDNLVTIIRCVKTEIDQIIQYALSDQLRTIGVNGSLPLPIKTTRGKMKEEGHQ